MLNSFSDSYKSAGVDIEAGYASVNLMKEHVERTRVKGAFDALGGFGGLFLPDLSGMKEPVLVSGTDGVGTKLKLAFLLNRHDTIGIDCVAMCVNDIICSGAKPLFFLDYIACGKNSPEKIAQIVKGIADGCVSAGCALVGGETAEMPGFYKEDEYDLAGFSVGIVDRPKITDKTAMQVGDAIIGLESTGLHSNGFSLVRKVFNINNPDRLAIKVHGSEHTLGEILLAPTAIYVKPVLKAIENIKVSAISHITGGGFYENVPRSFPEHLAAVVKKDSYPVHPIFKLLQDTGHIPEHDMYNTFNMGIGMTLVVPKADAKDTLRIIGEAGQVCYQIGEVTERTDNGAVVIV
ncbi:MAG: phosphoribosylformylglycinamidine cyclo-ligase [Oscillospiraceae bacterium]|jgi:phosphoribosylformylglycinamidine cyclo-ligase|nr:phosphoribosylformylglycinamidine cyclo-ligase [Oscillospiraceae bacterium]